MDIVRTVKDRAYISGFVLGAFKVVMAVISHSWLIFIHAIYNIIKASARHYAAKERHGRYNTMFCSGLLVIAASAVYLGYSLYIYVYGSSASYHMYVAIGIAAVTTYELVLAICGQSRARKRKEPQQEAIKLINLASALISVSLTQTAILSFTNAGEDMSRYYAIGDAIFGFLAMLVGIIMLLRANHLEANK